MNTFQEIIDWSEAWALLIPLTFYLIWKPKDAWVKPVVIYLVIAFVLNLVADMIWKKGLPFLELPIRDAFPFLYVPQYTQISNNIFYNVHSIIRMLLFTWFFYKLDPFFFKKLNLAVIPLFVGFTIINFYFFANNCKIYKFIWPR